MAVSSCHKLNDFNSLYTPGLVSPSIMAYRNSHPHKTYGVSMAEINRRDMMKSSAALWVASRLGGFSNPALASTSSQTNTPAAVWAHHIRAVIAEGYTPPFYPTFEYDPERAIAIASELNCDCLRY